MSATPSSTILSTGRASSGQPSQAQTAYEALREMLVTLEIAPGEPISEAALTDRLGVGRTPLREAVNRLTEERLVQKYPRRGTFATEVNLADLPLLTDLRVEIEGLAAARAAVAADDGDRAGLAALSPVPGERPVPVQQMRLDTEIHRAVYAATHNPFLVETAMRYHNLSRRIWYVFMDRLPDLGTHVEEHRALIGHVLAGEADAARDVAAHHVRNFADEVRQLL